MSVQLKSRKRNSIIQESHLVSQLKSFSGNYDPAGVVKEMDVF